MQVNNILHVHFQPYVAMYMHILSRIKSMKSYKIINLALFLTEKLGDNYSELRAYLNRLSGHICIEKNCIK